MSTRQIWTIVQHDGPNHLELWVNAGGRRRRRRGLVFVLTGGDQVVRCCLPVQPLRRPDQHNVERLPEETSIGPGGFSALLLKRVTPPGPAHRPTRPAAAAAAAQSSGPVPPPMVVTCSTSHWPGRSTSTGGGVINMTVSPTAHHRTIADMLPSFCCAPLYPTDY